MDCCQNYGPFLAPENDTPLRDLGDPEGDHNVDNHPSGMLQPVQSESLSHRWRSNAGAAVFLQRHFER